VIEQFHKPATIREALALKARFRNRSAFLAGGTWLNSRDSADPPKHVISLERLGLDRIVPHRGRLAIGAMCTLQQLIDAPKVPAALRMAISQIASRNIRDMATIGGHVASHLQFSDVIPMLIDLDADVVVARPGRATTLPIADYVAKPGAGLITTVVLPKPAPGRLTSCRRLRASANSRSVVSAAVSFIVSRGMIRQPIIALGGVTTYAVRLKGIEEELDGQRPPALDDLQARVSRSVRTVATPGASASYRRYAAGAAVALAFQDALRQREGRS
jgi:putative selenate reductase FAD-binding subunit